MANLAAGRSVNETAEAMSIRPATVYSHRARISRKLGVVPRQQRTGLAALSKQERAVVALIAAGKTSREIADHLGIAETTVEVYRRRIKKKLGISASKATTLLDGYAADLRERSIDSSSA